MILEDVSLIKQANKLGLKVVVANWWNSKDTTYPQIMEQLKHSSKASQLTSLNMMDEPVYNGKEKHSPEYYQKLRTKIHKTHPTLPLSLTIYGPKEDWNCAEKKLFEDYLGCIDHLRIDPYPLVAKKPLRTVYDWPVSAIKSIKKTGREIPLTVILQAWSPGDDEAGVPKLPSKSQLRCMIYLAMFSGAETISFYNYNTKVWSRKKGFQQEFEDLVREILAVQKSCLRLKYRVRETKPEIFHITPVSGTGPSYTIDTKNLKVKQD